jgi:hypothetical protein
MNTRKVQLFLAARDGIAVDDLKAGLAAESARICGFLPKNAHCRLSFRLSGNPLGQSAHGAEIVKASPPFDAIVEVSKSDASFEDLTKAIDGLAGRLVPWIDPARSIAIAGTEHQITPGSAPLLLAFPLRRLTRLTHREFLDYWLNVHAEYGRKARVPPIKYWQFHGDETASQAAAALAGVAIHDFDGVAMSYFTDIPELQDLLDQPSVASAALEDEKKFIDHSRSIIGLCEIAQDVTI